jgi:hypothetical protein
MENQDKKVSIIGLHEQTPRFVVSRQGTTVCRAKKAASAYTLYSHPGSCAV